MTTPVTIQTALSKLDVKNDSDWTADGLPRIDSVRTLSGDATLTREQITLSAPGFSRANATLAAQPAPAATAAAPVVAPLAPSVAPAAPQAAQDTVQQQLTPEVAPVTPATGDSAPDDAASPIAALVALEQNKVANDAASLASLEDDINIEQEQLGKMTVVRDSMNKQIAQQQKSLDALLTKRQTLEPRNANTLAIQSYLASQRVKLEERRKRIEAFKGIDLKSLLPTFAPIDAAMKRRTQRGTQRPQIPLVK